VLVFVFCLVHYYFAKRRRMVGSSFDRQAESELYQLSGYSFFVGEEASFDMSEILIKLLVKKGYNWFLREF